MSVFLICEKMSKERFMHIKHMYLGLLNTKQNGPWIKPPYILDTGKGLYQICKQHKDAYEYLNRFTIFSASLIWQKSGT